MSIGKASAWRGKAAGIDAMRPWQRAQRLRRLLLSVGLAAVAATIAQAQSSRADQVLDWPRDGEVLHYRSCGCADDCWVAEVTDRRTHVLKARLRCDCETLFSYRPLAEPARAVAGRCEVIHASGDKLGAIRERLQQLLLER